MTEEKLLELLSELGENEIENAVKTDDKDALAAYQKKKARASLFSSRFWVRGAVLAASLALVCGVLLLFPHLFSDYPAGGSPPSSPGNSCPPPEDSGTCCPGDIIGDVQSISSLDMLNYYGALLSLSGKWEAASLQGASVVSTRTEGKPSVSALPLSLLSEEDIVTYELDPDEVFWVTCALFFRIRISEPDGFLASKVGTGTVDVVITENSLDTMITFKNGDRYFSCLINGLSAGNTNFSTHKYIDGFSIVKNLAQENYRFTVRFEGEHTDMTSWRVKSLEVSSLAGQSFSADGVLYALGMTYASAKTSSFTLRDLEQFFKSEPLPDVPAKRTWEYSDGLSRFVFAEDGSMTYTADDHAAPFRAGRFEEREGELVLFFMTGGVLAESTVCPKTPSGGFVYRGRIFELWED